MAVPALLVRLISGSRSFAARVWQMTQDSSAAIKSGRRNNNSEGKYAGIGAGKAGRSVALAKLAEG